MHPKKYREAYQKAALSRYLVTALREARGAHGLTQRALGSSVGLTQGHLSKIEAGEVDLQVSTLVELARALGLEVVLVPRKVLPAMKAIAREAMNGPAEIPEPAYSLDDEDDLDRSERHDLG